MLSPSTCHYSCRTATLSSLTAAAADEAWAVGGGAGDNDDPNDAAARPALLGLPHLTDADADAAAAALQRRVEAAGVGVAGRTADGAATAAARAVRLFGRPGPKSDWADGLVVALDLLARARRERLEGDKRVKGLRMTLVSNFVGQVRGAGAVLGGRFCGAGAGTGVGAR